LIHEIKWAASRLCLALRIPAQHAGQAARPGAIGHRHPVIRSDDPESPLLIFGREPLVFLGQDQRPLIEAQGVAGGAPDIVPGRLQFDLFPFPERRRQALGQELGIIGQQPLPVKRHDGIQVERVWRHPDGMDLVWGSSLPLTLIVFGGYEQESKADLTPLYICHHGNFCHFRDNRPPTSYGTF